VLVSAFVFLLVIFSCQEIRHTDDRPLIAFPEGLGRAPVMRMVIRRKTRQVPMNIDGPFRIYDAEGNEVPNSNTRLWRVYVGFDGRQLWLGNQAMAPHGRKMARMRISPDRVGSLELFHKIYPGDVEFIGVPGTKTVHCVVHMNIEEYVCGVLAGEVPVGKWHDQALKAQAVTSRTYAMYYHLLNRKKAWDFGTTGREAQQYKAGIVRNARINRAVNSTRGQLLTWQNRVFPAYFHSSCGGHTLDSAKVFNRVSIKPLAGAECKWCGDPKLNKYARWKRTFAMGTIAHRLDRAAGRLPEFRKLRGRGGVRALEIAEKTEDGRITRFRVRVHLSPGSYEFLANDVRLALGPNELMSTKCRIATNKSRPPSRYYFEGNGWGHGVGLCQWGSLGMARAGYDYQDILATYYPYSRIIRMNYEEPEQSTVARTAPPPAAAPRKSRKSRKSRGAGDERPKG
jgi:stage II sporulation protein D